MPLTDTDKMPFGKHKGDPMRVVPASYLIYLDGEIRPKAPNKRTLAEKLVLEYIEENKEVLLKEMKDGKA